MIAIRKSKPPLPLTKCPLVEDNGLLYTGLELAEGSKTRRQGEIRC
jgi:hypothetical protein